MTLHSKSKKKELRNGCKGKVSSSKQIGEQKTSINSLNVYICLLVYSRDDLWAP